MLKQPLQEAFSRILRLFIFLGAILLVSCSEWLQPEHYREADFNAGWSYCLGDVGNASEPDLDTKDWKPVHLPHDWSIEDYPIQDSLHQGPFYKNLPGGSDVGYLRDGIAWYRKEFQSPGNFEGKRMVLHFDGVQTMMELWVNGELCGEHVYGYSPFEFDITPYIYGEGELNALAVKTINPGENSRWFAGAGIYRPVHISLLNQVAIVSNGVHITTEVKSPGLAVINVGVEMENLHDERVEAGCRLEILSPEGETIAFETSSLILAADSRNGVDISAEISNPKLWGPGHPELYNARVSIFCKDRETDLYESSFGIRSISYSAKEGFLLNGEVVLLKGGCMHHDNGLLGAAAFPDAEYRRVKILKECGFNAIRSSHNPPSASFLEACDVLGMLVIDEAFDHWVKPKRPHDYSNYFLKHYKKDIHAMVRRDRNHPSVVMWSFGNEVQERADPEGIEIGKKLIAAIREVDDTRPVTQAVCDFWDNPGREWDYSAGAFEIQDIGGYNYMYKAYESDHQMYPDRIIYGSETFPLYAWENWELVKEHPWVIGDFVWTGMDYLGESGIGHVRYVDKDEAVEGFHQPWPWYVSWCGDIDITGNKKPQSFYRDVVWGESRLEMMVCMPVPEGKTAQISNWGWYDELNSWNLEDQEGQVVKVRVYTSYPEVSLELNGEVIGSKTMEGSDRYIAEFDVKYSPGILTATGTDGEETESISLKTSKEASRLVLNPETEAISAHRNSLAFIRVEAMDEDGVPVINDESELVVELSGAAELLAAGNASPLHDGSFTDEKLKLFRGRGLIILRSDGHPGEIKIRVRSGQNLVDEVLLVAH